MLDMVFDSLTEYNEMAHAVIEAMLTLPDELWLVLFHRFYNHLTWSEVERVLGLEEEQAGKLEAQALRALREPRVIKMLCVWIA